MNFLDREEHWHTIKLKESVYINAKNPGKELSEMTNLDKGYPLNHCCNEFLSDMREVMRI